MSQALDAFSTVSSDRPGAVARAGMAAPMATPRATRQPLSISRVLGKVILTVRGPFDDANMALLEEAHVESSGPDEVVARFAGRAGPFSYRTLEAVRFNDQAVSFEHLEGPLRSCAERCTAGSRAGFSG